MMTPNLTNPVVDACFDLPCIQVDCHVVIMEAAAVTSLAPASSIQHPASSIQHLRTPTRVKPTQGWTKRLPDSIEGF